MSALMWMSKRELAARVLGSSAGRLLNYASAQGGRSLRILAYHRVLDADPNDFAFDEGVISASTEAFYRQMDFVRRNFDVLTFKDLYRLETEEKSWPRRALLITFDDGYRDNYTQAFPILKQLGLPATIFLATGHIGRAKMFWWDLIAYCVKHSNRKAANLDEVCPAAMDFTSAAGRHDATERILRWVKSVPDAVKNRFLDGLGNELEVDLPAGLAEGMHLSWDEVKEMADSGIEFGSHTVTHPVLRNVSEAKLDEELTESKKMIEQQLGRDCLVLAYPVGGRQNFNESVQAAARRSGYQYAVSYDEGLATLEESDRYAMPRIHVESDQSLSLFRATSMFPSFMFSR
jgi:peptidoglycan/xylan/chitin deacetylase (PgdA/CDA1 family)